MPPPPPPPSCFPFTRSKSSGYSKDDKAGTHTRSSLGRSHTISSASTLTSKAEKLTFTSDSISWDNVPVDDTTRSPKRSPKGSPKGSPNGRNALSPISSRISAGFGGGNASPVHSRSNSSKSKGIFNPFSLSRNNSSSSTLVGSAFERKVADASIPPEPRVDSGPKLVELRKLMAKENIAYYIVPSTDAHGSEYLAPCDKRRQWLTGFTGSAGTAVIAMDQAYLFVDSRYYIQAARQLDDNWTLMKVGWDGQKNWDDWLIDRVRGAKIGIDSRMISLEATNKMVAALTPRASSLMFPWQNLVDLVWKERPVRPKDPIYVQPVQFTGEDAKRKLSRVRDWITKSAPMTERFSTNPPKDKDIPIAAFLADLADIAWTLNLRGSDIPYTPVFMSYLFITMENAILFIENGKISEEVREYLNELGVQTKEYSEVWPFLRSKDWGAGKVLISPDVPYTVARSLTSLRYAVMPPFVAMRRMIKNEVELAGMERAYLRDGAAMVRFFAWLDEKISQGYEIDEYQAAMRLKEFRAQSELYQGLAYEAIAGTGPNAALPHYVPPRHGSLPIDRKTPFLIDAGGQYRDGTCDTTRTVHFGKPTDAQAEAFTRVLQGHISIDTAIFPEGTSGAKLDVLARRALWQDGLNYLHGTGHGVGSFLSVHELHIGFSREVPLEPGQVISNEPGFYLEGDFGVRIESVLAVQRVQTKNEFQGPIWLGFKRLTQVPIQLKMIKASMLSKEERNWVRNHNEECRRKLEPLLREDKRALRWLRKECQPAFRSEASVSGVSIEWD